MSWRGDEDDAGEGHPKPVGPAAKSDSGEIRSDGRVGGGSGSKVRFLSEVCSDDSDDDEVWL